ncbi:hypothetical protein FB45DRAFT_155338 [Roridomyces roridus]|uniref:Uncharacterized protein n=1 Tax=Roridomyces roridus TaxID=1738132 RepID=A0AAD7BER4_9AGAR|nr:hypothetical protein FB45DRAFT_155338 [Roridomyces roridus]
MLAVSFAFLLVAPAAFAATTPSPLLSLRQSLPTSDDGCESACTALENAVENAANSAKSTAALCTSAIVNDYATCYSCLISEGAMSQSLAQETVDDYVSSCRSAGFSVNGATVSGSSSGGGGSLGDPSIRAECGWQWELDWAEYCHRECEERKQHDSHCLRSACVVVYCQVGR